LRKIIIVELCFIDFKTQILKRLCRQNLKRAFLKKLFFKGGDNHATHLAGAFPQALQNGIVETDVPSLCAHLIATLRKLGVSKSMSQQVPVAVLRNVLLSADELCLSRMHVHVLLSLLQPSEGGLVEVR
jgi:hypothetical protein